jgi:AraC-like DNA-binding protein
MDSRLCLEGLGSHPENTVKQATKLDFETLGVQQTASFGNISLSTKHPRFWGWCNKLFLINSKNYPSENFQQQSRRSYFLDAKNSLSAMQNGHSFGGASMNTKLNTIQNWPELARQAKWSASTLAKLCGVSVRTLHRYFRQHMSKNTRTWLDEQRQHNAHALLCDGSSIKETAACLGYKQQSNFTRHYKQQTGFCPSQQPPANLI